MNDIDDIDTWCPLANYHTVPSIRIRRQLLGVIAGPRLARLFDVEQDHGSQLGCGTFHGRTARTTVGPNDQRGRGILVDGLE